MLAKFLQDVLSMLSRRWRKVVFADSDDARNDRDNLR